MYQFGCLAALEDYLGGAFSFAKLDLYVGTSAGAVVAALLANGISPDAACRSIVGRGPYRSLAFDRRDIYEVPWRAIFRTALRALRIVPVAYRAWRQYGGWPSPVDALSVLQEALPGGFFTNRRLRRFLRRAFREVGGTDDFRALKKRLLVTAVDLDTGERIVFGRRGWDDVPVSLAVQASCTLPVVFEPVSVRGRDLVDGALARTAHLDLVAEEGAELVFVINGAVPLRNDKRLVCLPSVAGTCASIREKGAFFVGEQAERLMNSQRLRMDLASFEHDAPRASVLLVQPPPEETLYFLQSVLTASTRSLLINYGYNLAMSHLTARHQALSGKLRRFRFAPDLGRLVRNKYASE